MAKTLVFAIFDFDRFSKHDQIGEVKIPLCQLDLAQTIEDWKELQSVEGEGGQVKQKHLLLSQMNQRNKLILILMYLVTQLIIVISVRHSTFITLFITAYVQHKYSKYLVEFSTFYILHSFFTLKTLTWFI